MDFKTFFRRMLGEEQKPEEGWPTQERFPSLRDVPERELDAMSYFMGPASLPVPLMGALLTRKQFAQGLAENLGKQVGKVRPEMQKALKYIAETYPARALMKMESIPAVDIPKGAKAEVVFKRQIEPLLREISPSPNVGGHSWAQERLIENALDRLSQGKGSSVYKELIEAYLAENARRAIE